MSDFDFPPDLVAAEREAWAAIQAGTLTPELAGAVQDRLTAYAAEVGVDRYTAEMALKRAVRHAEG
ncbi:hypothetical protein [Streptomyces sp. TRM75561]|uniref:hypothetical protein n=1 Tax=Streptomyces sp. TRM75561 TaxID=2975269 RepID=UPI002448495C|nr:hypothetical protein [Streptomyces sp. TRM75561]MDH3037952.1 hypothetical protein [Streptomyces sp. TRM75561]